MTIKTWEDYIEQLCRLHPVLAHEQSGRRAFLPFGSEEASTTIGQDVADTYVRHDGFFFNGRLGTQWVYSSSLLVLQVLGPGNRDEAISQARHNTQLIVEQLDARIIWEFEQADKCHLFADLLDAEVEPIGPIDGNSYGWQLMLTLADHKMEYDETLWLDYTPAT